MVLSPCNACMVHSNNWWRHVQVLTLQDLLHETDQMNNRIRYDIIQSEHEIVDMLAQKEREDQSLCACLTSTNANLERRAQATLLETARHREFKPLTKAISETYMYMKMMESDTKKICMVESCLEQMLGIKMKALSKQKGYALAIRNEADVKLQEARAHFRHLSAKEYRARALQLNLSKVMADSSCQASDLRRLLKDVGGNALSSSETRRNLIAYNVPLDTSTCVAEIKTAIQGNNALVSFDANKLLFKLQSLLKPYKMQACMHPKGSPEDQKCVNVWEQIVKSSHAREKEYEKQLCFRQKLEKARKDALTRMATLKMVEKDLQLLKDKLRQQKLLNDMANIKSRSSASKSIKLIEDMQTTQFQHESDKISILRDIIALLEEEKSLIKHRNRLSIALGELDKAILRQGKNRTRCHCSGKKLETQCNHSSSDNKKPNLRIPLESRIKKVVFQMIEQQIQ